MARPQIFDFSHPELRRPGVEFVRDTDRTPLLRKDFGELRGTHALEDLPGALGLPEDHPDDALLALVPAALLYQRRVAHGDPVPGEIREGRPSWAPKPHLLNRATALVIKAVEGRMALRNGGKPLPQSARNLLAIADLLAQELETTSREEILARLDGIVADLGRVDWLRGAASELQRCVGELAQYSAARAGSPAGDLARQCALLLRTPMIWATEKAMAADAAVGDVNRLLANPTVLRAKAWPLMNELRAFILDVEPVVRHWAAMRPQSDALRPEDWKDMLRLAGRRFARFDPSLYRIETALGEYAPGAADD